MSIERRIQKAERTVGIHTKPAVIPGLIMCRPYKEGVAPHFPEPADEWLTLRETVENSRRQLLPCILWPAPFAEYEVRYGLEPGTLANHPLCGKVPFAELLASATGQAEGDQTCTAD
jgi:hypothetical protein